MPDEPIEAGSPPPPSRRRRRFKQHELELADGGKLILAADGSIERVDEGGARKRAWTPDDPEWASLAIRFGLLPEGPTLTPRGRGLEATKPPHG